MTSCRTTCSFSKPCAQAPITKPGALNVQKAVIGMAGSGQALATIFTNVTGSCELFVRHQTIPASPDRRRYGTRPLSFECCFGRTMLTLVEFLALGISSIALLVLYGVVRHWLSQWRRRRRSKDDGPA